MCLITREYGSQFARFQHAEGRIAHSYECFSNTTAADYTNSSFGII